MICHYWLFNHGFKFQDSAFNGCRVLTTLSVNINNIPISTIKNFDYRCTIHNISKSKTINLLEKSVLEMMDIYKKYCLNFRSIQNSFFFYLFCLVYIKWLIVWLIILKLKKCVSIIS